MRTGRISGLFPANVTPPAHEHTFRSVLVIAPSLNCQARQFSPESVRSFDHSINVLLSRDESASLEFSKVPNQSPTRYSSAGLESGKGARRPAQGTENVDSAWMRKGRRHFEDEFNGLRMVSEDLFQCRYKIGLGNGVRVRVWRGPIFHPPTGAADCKKAPGFHRSQVLARDRERQR
jgi:hypothetical protein